MRFTPYFLATRLRSDRAGIAMERIERVVTLPERQAIRADGRCWARIEETSGRDLRVVLLQDG
jgi:hypothetical protein